MAKKIKIKCSRCGATKTGSEYDNELWLVNHTCKGMRNLMTMNADLLLKVINKELTENQAWDIIDGKKVI